MSEWKAFRKEVNKFGKRITPEQAYSLSDSFNLYTLRRDQDALSSFYSIIQKGTGASDEMIRHLIDENKEINKGGPMSIMDILEKTAKNKEAKGAITATITQIFNLERYDALK